MSFNIPHSIHSHIIDKTDCFCFDQQQFAGLDGNRRKSGAMPRDEAGEVERRDGVEAAEPNDTGLLRADRQRFLLAAACLAQQRARRSEKGAALWGELGAARVMAFEQAEREQLFELVERLRHRWLRDVQYARSLGDATRFGHGDEIGALLEGKSNHISLF